jgi:hypothetical protein
VELLTASHHTLKLLKVNVRFGSQAEVKTLHTDVRFAPYSGPITDTAALQLCELSASQQADYRIGVTLGNLADPLGALLGSQPKHLVSSPMEVAVKFCHPVGIQLRGASLFDC